MCVCVCARTGLYFNVPQCSAPRPRVWQKQMLNWAPAAGLRTKLPSHKAISPSRQWLCRPVQRFYPVFTPFVHHKSSADARRGRKKKKNRKMSTPKLGQKVLLALLQLRDFKKAVLFIYLFFPVFSWYWCHCLLNGLSAHLGHCIVFDGQVRGMMGKHQEARISKGRTGVLFKRFTECCEFACHR